jgi:hypothetical protein
LPSQAFLNKLKSHVAQRVFKVEVLDQNENIIDELSKNVIDGSITITDESGARRSAQIIFENSNGLFTPNPNGYIWKNRKFRISTGLVLDDGTEEYVSRGIYVCGEVELISEFSNTEVIVQFYDKFCLIDGTLRGKLKNNHLIPVNTTIFAAVNSILQSAGEVKSAIIESTSETTPYTIIKTTSNNSSYGDMLKELAAMLSWKCFYDNEGYFRFQPPTNVLTDSSVWDFSTNEVTYLGSRNRQEYSKIYNSIVVIGQVINGATVRATAVDTSSDLGIASSIGECVLVVEDDLIYNNTLAQERANYELQNAISTVSSVDMNAIPVDIIDGSNIISAYDTQADLTDRYLVKSLTFPLVNNNNMTLNVWKGREIV